MWPDIPHDVVNYVRTVVRDASQETTEWISNQPNVRETTLDDTLVNAIGKHAAPKHLPSNTVVKIEVHNIGGLRQWESWELADIAFVVHVFSKNCPLVQKIGLLQSKRIYPDNLDVDVDDPIKFQYGLNGLIYPPEFTRPPLKPTTYKFTENSIYGAIAHNGNQLKRINDFHSKFGESIFYLLYHPHEIPFEHTLPATGYRSISCSPLGPRVVRTQVVASVLSDISRLNRSPSFKEIRSTTSADEYWRLEQWVADFLLQCRVGRQYSIKEDKELINRLIERRSGPIGAAIRINIALPD